MAVVSARREVGQRLWVAVAGAPCRWPGLRVSMLLAGAAIGCQVAYPLVGGAARDVLTVTTVVVFSAASLSHAWIARGSATALALAGIFVGGGLAVEIVGVATGFPFGSYDYSDRLGPMVADVPLVIPLAWAMIGYPALVVARRITTRRWLGVTIAGIALAAWDLFLDPQMVAEGYWRWSGAGPHLIGTVPATNYLAWLAISWLMMAAAWPLTAGWSTLDDDRVPVVLYLWTWLGSSVAHVAFLGLWQSGLYGGVAMGSIVMALLWASAARAAGAPDRPAG